MHLEYLSADPALFFQTHFMYLPDTSTFHRVMHLDLTTHWALDTIPLDNLFALAATDYYGAHTLITEICQDVGRRAELDQVQTWVVQQGYMLKPTFSASQHI